MNNPALHSCIFSSGQAKLNKPFPYNSWIQPKEVLVIYKTLPDVKIAADQAVKLIRKVCFGDFQADICANYHPVVFPNDGSFIVKLLFSETAR